MRAFRLTLWILVAVALFGLGALAVLTLRQPASVEAGNGGMAPGAPLGGPFALVDQNGEPVTEALFRDKPSAVFFGFTHCPDVCPTTLMEAAGWIDALGAGADEMRFVFVTVDPARDTPQVMKDYISAFSDKIVGVTGEPQKVEAMVADYKIYSRKVPLEGGEYTMDHTASVLLLDEDGAFVGTIAPDESSETAVAKLQRLVAG
jgi:protein SCO1/2